MRNKILIALVALGVLSVILPVFTAHNPPRIDGKLTGNDAAQITRIVRWKMKRDIWRDNFPAFSLARLKQLPSTLQQICSDRILYIGGSSDDKVWVLTGVDGDAWYSHGTQYVLKRDSNRWSIRRTDIWRPMSTPGL